MGVARDENTVKASVAQPPASPAYNRLFGNQIRWALQVIRYTLQQRKA